MKAAYSCHFFECLGMRIFATFSMETIQSSGNVSLAAKLQFWRAELGYGSGHLQFIIPGCGDLLYLGHCSAFQKEHFAELWVNFCFFLTSSQQACLDVCHFDTSKKMRGYVISGLVPRMTASKRICSGIPNASETERYRTVDAHNCLKWLQIRFQRELF